MRVWRDDNSTVSFEKMSDGWHIIEADPDGNITSDDPAPPESAMFFEAGAAMFGERGAP